MWILLLLVACAAAASAGARLCLAGVAAGGVPGERRGPAAEVGVYETAFLAGGPGRVTDTALVALAGRRRVLLAHTGWVTVVAPDDEDGLDEVECALMAAAGPDGQASLAAIRAAHAATDAVRALGERLAATGLAVPLAARERVAAGVRQVRGATALTLAMAAATLALNGSPRTAGGTPALLWYVLPLLLTCSCWAVAGVEFYPYTRWASAAGQDALRAIPRAAPPLLALAARGPRVLPDPGIRAALRGRHRT
ncbi:TIGR04222 domain-containing membrane protein [Actinacidiphila alni]|uniref:TIGR04222 domain-containing membrane protein n=1 Tax=Actinacidiphila alni TaxID=380248 RepID=UPI0034525452